MAEGVVEQVIDKAWIQQAVAHFTDNDETKNVGILDPACGSGTFLFHAARRILNSPALQNLNPTKQANFITRLINGIDIHPVAVEISKATLLRALPAIPDDGVNSLKVFQGDSLMWDSTIKSDVGQLSLDAHSSNQILKFDSPEGQQIKIPKKFAIQSTFNGDIHKIVAQAGKSLDMPLLKSKLEIEDMQVLEKTFTTLKRIIKNEGDSVWAWYIINYTAPLAIHHKKVDRIISNPPWLRVSNIQVESRKKEIEDLAKELGLWGQGKNNTGFDIAALFIERCRSQYLTNNNKKYAAWVLPWGAWKAGNWENIRIKQTKNNTKIWDLSKIKEPPFTGSKACVWFQDENSPPGVNIKDVRYKPQIIVFKNKFKQKIESENNWTQVYRAISLEYPPYYDIQPSPYYEKSLRFAQGATLVPHNLIRISSVEPDSQTGMTKIITTQSRHNPWKDLGQQTGEIPNYWIQPVVFPRDLLIFGIRKTITQVIIPHNLQAKDPSMKTNDYWQKAEAIYHKNRGKGKSNPQNLYSRINYQNKIVKQIIHNKSPGATTKSKVIYNTSGQWLRASRINPQLLAESGCYHSTFDIEEAAYLVSILNADCLQKAFQQTRKSDRHFHQHFWREIPIPRFDSSDKNHQKLVNLCHQAEKIAQTIINYANNSLGQLKLSSLIKEKIKGVGTMREIDEVARQILPDYAS